MALATEHAPAERRSQKVLEEQYRLVAGLPFVSEILDAIPNMTVLLNECRQIVFANTAFCAFIGITGGDELITDCPREAVDCIYADYLGKRPGETVGCVNADLSEGGCGTTLFCRTCGAVRSILNSQEGHSLDIQECRMVYGEDRKPLDLRVWSHPLEIEGNHFTVFSVLDISDEKRRKALEQIFFHDVLNTAGGVKGLADLLTEMELSEEDKREIVLMLSSSSDQLVEEINAQRFLMEAERGDMAVWAQDLRAGSVLEGLRRQFHAAPCAEGKTMVIAGSVDDISLTSDPVLLRRVLGNLVKNAFEATEEGEEIAVSCVSDESGVSFSVRNSAVLSEEVQNQIFQRSFSTKGNGRGIGTYSVKLLTEKYLLGDVSLRSSQDEGTVFTVRFPHRIEGTCADLETLKVNTDVS